MGIERPGAIAAVAFVVCGACGGAAPEAHVASTVDLRAVARPSPQSRTDGAPGHVPAAKPSDDRCMPVASCSMFRPGTAGLCASVAGDGGIDLPELADAQESITLLEHVCEGDPGAPPALRGCIDYVETRMSCRWRAPNVPDYRCGFTDGECKNVGPAR